MLLIPHQTTTNSAEIWFADRRGTQPAPRIRLSVSGAGTDTELVLPATWDMLPTLGKPTFVGRVKLGGLKPDSRYLFRAKHDEAQSTFGPTARVRTLPKTLPTNQAPPFVIGLSSCFYLAKDRTGQSGSITRRAPADLLPHVKFLCGDQVYLDLPVQQDLPSHPQKLFSALFDKYWLNWTQGDDEITTGFSSYLRWGSNLFVSDDHEWWNNYPFATAIASNTWTSGGRKQWSASAHALFRAFQTFNGEPKMGEITIGTPGQPGSLEIRAIDGRIFRTKNLSHNAAELRAITGWLARLKQPGILVLSQPIFERSVGWFQQNFKDAGIVDLDDFPELAEAIYYAPHDVLILSGDIHAARVCRTGGWRSRVVELVSSPLSLCQGHTHQPQPASNRFPPRAVAGTSPTKVTSTTPLLENHSLVLEIVQIQGGFRVTPTYWPTDPSHKPVKLEAIDFF